MPILALTNASAINPSPFVQLGSALLEVKPISWEYCAHNAAAIAKPAWMSVARVIQPRDLFPPSRGESPTRPPRNAPPTKEARDTSAWRSDISKAKPLPGPEKRRTRARESWIVFPKEARVSRGKGEVERAKMEMGRTCLECTPDEAGRK